MSHGIPRLSHVFLGRSKSTHARESAHITSTDFFRSFAVPAFQRLVQVRPRFFFVHSIAALGLEEWEYRSAEFLWELDSLDVAVIRAMQSAYPGSFFLVDLLLLAHATNCATTADRMSSGIALHLAGLQPNAHIR